MRPERGETFIGLKRSILFADANPHIIIHGISQGSIEITYLIKDLFSDEYGRMD
jgi:hypothetical protein